VVTADVARDVTGAALREILAEITRLNTEPPTMDEINRYQRFMAGGLIYENSTSRGVIESLRWVDLYNADPSYFTDFVRHVFAVQSTDFNRVIGAYLPVNRLAIVVVGDSTAIKTQLAQVGRVVE
jgi:predicted Zn-dependent peptidase